MSQLSSAVGPVATGDGVVGAPVRQDRTRALVMKMAAGKYAEAVLRGNCYYAMIPPGTGQAPGTALGATAHLSIANPANSGKRIRLLGVSSGYISGTLGAGPMFICANSTGGQAAPTGGTAITPTNALITNANSSIAKVAFGSTLPATPLALEALFSMFAELATTANGFQGVNIDLNGRYLIDQSGIISLEGVAVGGTSPLLASGFFWEEVAIGAE